MLKFSSTFSTRCALPARSSRSRICRGGTTNAPPAFQQVVDVAVLQRGATRSQADREPRNSAVGLNASSASRLTRVPVCTVKSRKPVTESPRGDQRLVRAKRE